jgi:hypothetical protein
MHGSTIAAVIVAAIIIAFVIWGALYTRSRRLQSRFGPEYSRAVDTRGRWRAETELASRERRVHRLRIRPLTPEEHDRFADAWRRVQERFVDDPPGAVTQADLLLTDLMKTRGYPAWDADFEQRAADLSVDHAEFVQNYRAAAAISRNHRMGRTTTEDLRKAMVHYRALFDDLLEEVEEPSHARHERTIARGA